MDWVTIEEIDLQNKRVLVRADLNVPLDDDRNITDDTRIRAVLPTLRYLQAQGARIVLMSHLGRPKGVYEEKYSMRPVAQRLSELLSQEVALAADCTSEETRKKAEGLAQGELLLLENTRFYPGETENDPDFARKLAALGEVFVNDAFGAAHRAHASTVGVADYLPAVAGLLLEKELRVLNELLENPRKPFTAVIGGAKISDKIGVISNLLKKVDHLIVGGGMANTFLKAAGRAMGDSLVEEEKVALAAQLLEDAHKRKVELHLPSDLVIAKTLDGQGPVEIVADGVPEGFKALDIGRETAEAYAGIIVKSALVLWNGPMGVFEVKAFAEGTKRIAQAMADCQGMTIIGGGDSVAAVEAMGLADKIDHISTGGGASLEFLEGRQLPGVAVLRRGR